MDNNASKKHFPAYTPAVCADFSRGYSRPRSMASNNFAFAEGAETIRVGLIGCGGRGTGAAVQALRASENVKLVAMGEAFKDRLDEQPRKHHQGNAVGRQPAY